METNQKDRQCPKDKNMSACSVAATYKPPMLVPRARLPAGALGTNVDLIGCVRYIQLLTVTVQDALQAK